MSPTPMLRPLGIGEILDAGIKLYVRHWKVLTICVVGLILPLRIVNALLVLSANPNAFTTSTRTTSTTTSTELLVAELIVVLMIGLTTLLATAACFKAVADAWLGAEPTAGRSLRYALRRLPALVGMSILLFLLFLLFALLFLLPVVWFAVSASLAIPALLFERVGPWRSIKRSVSLVRGRWWGTLATLLVGYLLVAIIAGLIGAVFQLVPAALTDSSVALAAGNVIGSTIGSLLTTPYSAAVVTLLYFDRRVRKEGFDVQLLAEGLGDAERDPDAPLPAPLIEPEVSAEQRAAAPYWPPPPGWTPPEPDQEADSSRRWLPPAAPGHER